MSDTPNSNALKERKLKLQADPLDGAQQRNGRTMSPTLTVAVVDNQPRFTVYTNVEGDKQNGKIEGNMDSYTFYAVMNAIRDVASGTIKDAIAFANLGYFFDPVSRKRSESPGVKSKTVVGRDEQGRVFIGLSAKGRPFAKFIFGPGEFHNLSTPDGKPLSASITSELYAKAFASVIEKLVASVLVTEHKSDEEIQAAREANKARNGGGGGGYQNRNNGGGGYNKGNNNGGGYNKGGSGGYQNRNSGGGGGGGYSAEPASTNDYGDDIPF